jgi:hypothetical protein
MFAHTFLTKGEQQIWQYYNYTGKLPPSTFNPNTVKTLQDLGIDVSKSFPEGAQVAVGGTANQAVRQPGQGAPQTPVIPQGATGKAPGSDGKMHYHDAAGKDLGVAQ